MTTPRQRLIYGLILGLIAGATARAAERPSPDDPLAYRQQRFQRSDQYLWQLDTNHNGQIDASEVQGSREQHIFEHYLERTGLSPTFPMPISQIRAGLADWYHLSGDQIPPPPTTATSATTTTTSTTPAATSSSISQAGSSSTPTASLVPGFGVADGLLIPPGFGPPATIVSATTGSLTASYSSSSYSRPSSSFGSSSSTTTTSTSSSTSLDERYRSYVQGIVRKYDANKNGVLDHDEWKDLHGSIDYQAIAGRDGVVTVDALAAYLTKRYSKAVSSRSTSPYAAGATSVSSSTASKWKTYSADAGRGGVVAADSAGKGIRFLTPGERLPDGLPDWFRAKDANGDGQISMAEFATFWTDALVKEFNSYDLNGDGVITAQEVLAKMAADGASGSSRGFFGSDRSSGSSSSGRITPVSSRSYSGSTVSTTGSDPRAASTTASATGSDPRAASPSSHKHHHHEPGAE